jgi:hypothetical protein
MSNHPDVVNIVRRDRRQMAAAIICEIEEWFSSEYGQSDLVWARSRIRDVIETVLENEPIEQRELEASA